jgi:hypothetical protein
MNQRDTLRNVDVMHQIAEDRKVIDAAKKVIQERASSLGVQLIKENNPVPALGKIRNKA